MAIIPTRFDFAYFDEDVFDYIVEVDGLLEEIRVDFETGLDEHGHTVIWRQRSYTLDTDGSPTAIGSPTDTEIKSFLLPVFQEEEDKANRRFTHGRLKLFTLISRDIQNGDWIIDKDEDATGFTTVTGTSATQVVLSGDGRPDFAVNDYITTNDANNTGFYRITAIAYSPGDDETTLTVALDADPGTGDTVYKTALWKVEVSQSWPVDNQPVFRRCEIDKRQN